MHGRACTHRSGDSNVFSMKVGRNIPMRELPTRHSTSCKGGMCQCMCGEEEGKQGKVPRVSINVLAKLFKKQHASGYGNALCLHRRLRYEQ